LTLEAINRIARKEAVRVATAMPSPQAVNDLSTAASISRRQWRAILSTLSGIFFNPIGLSFFLALVCPAWKRSWRKYYEFTNDWGNSILYSNDQNLSYSKNIIKLFYTRNPAGISC
jgi:hypothetical protein